jgi:heme/copper-type cytochrome/quinol oxidase subunit 3
MFMHEKPFGGWIMCVGLAWILATMGFWWWDVIKEAEYQGHHTPIVQIGMRYGMLLFIASEVMFFVAFFWAFFDASLYPDTGVWPPAGVETFSAWDIPLINTLILLLSGCTVTWAHAALLKDDRENLINGLAYTILLGIAFTALQIYEYDHATFKFTDGIYSSTFYLATGFHGFHVFVGTCFLIVCWFRARAGHFTSEQHFGFEAAAWYWHFVDVVWLFLFVSIYWWGG